MKFNALGLMLCTFLIGCGSGDAPFGQTDGGTTTPDDGEPIASDRVVPPGTTSPEPASGIFRREPRDGDSGDGFAQGVRYNAADDTFFVDNLPFDGNEDEPYQRGTAVGAFGEYAVYEAVSTTEDDQNQAAISQFRHRAVYGVSRNDGATEFAIIRTGDYVQYGFGGFVYQRNGAVTLPTTGQAIYNGQGAGLRDYNSRGGLEYSTSDVQFVIDFDDFNEQTGLSEGAVDGFVFNRRVFDLNGNEITSSILTRIGEANNATLTALPTVRFIITPGSLDINGEATGTVFSTFADNDGQAVTFEEGQYYAILSGDDAEELVGVIVTETTLDPTSPDGARDTTGFTLYRGARE